MAATSGLAYKRKCSNGKVLQERLRNNPVLKAHFDSSRDVHHYKKLTCPTIRNHDLVKEHYRQFTAYLQQLFDKGKSEKPPQAPEIVIGTPLPILEYMKDFLCYLALALQGRDTSTFICYETLRGYMYTFLAHWPRYANIHPTTAIRYQLNTYIQSDQLKTSMNLSTKIRDLKHIEPQWLRILMETLHSASNIFCSHRTQLQIAFLILFSAASAARPGSIVESSCYHGSNEALTWGDLDFYLIPDDEDPAHPLLVVDIQLNLVKGYCDVDHRYQKVLFTLEIRKEHRMTCIVLPLLGLAFQDSVFAHFHSVDSLLCPERLHTTRVKLLLQNEVMNLLVFRKEEQGGISDTEAMTHGFPKLLTPYNLRASQGNKADVELGETARKTLMLHNPKSQVYFACRDTNAPTDLTLKERENLLNEPKLVKSQNEKNEATNKIQQLLANEQSEEVKAQIAELRQIAAKAYNTHCVLYWGELCLRIKQARQRFFDEAAVRQMLSPSEPILFKGLMAGNSNDSKYQIESSFLSLVNDLDTGDPVSDYCTLVNILISQPERILYHKFYPGEKPDDENKCPHCSQILTNLPSSTKPGEHVHHCTRKALSEDATAQTHFRKMYTRCKWQISPGVTCDAEDVEDWRAHFSEPHGFNLDESVLTEFCNWFKLTSHFKLYDIAGDRQELNNHHLAHYADLFDSFSSRPLEGTSVSLLPVGIIKTEKYIKYTPGTGFNGQLPEFHGHVSDNIALVPGFCPSCVFNEDLPMRKCMHHHIFPSPKTYVLCPPVVTIVLPNKNF
ncbi:hypothetical protein C8J55DRAFT_491970 [Lentinula edodes]|uniref:Uncharacterized protein n=1 Tax=Lentinula lateritia TaxID=40482 RepID=A0A9W8ZYB6_9AGAR|nr:hypothetical protein C8J55DRAFT_491970 [Lentinula edodes]